MCWQQIGYMMVIYIAGLQNVPIDLIEAARVDGATDFQTLVRIKIPMVMSNITICLFLTLTNSFKLFDQNLSLTNGLPGKDSQMLALNIYDTFYARSGLSGGNRPGESRYFLYRRGSHRPDTAARDPLEGGAAVMKQTMKRKKRRTDVIWTAALSLLCLVYIYPIALILSTP